MGSGGSNRLLSVRETAERLGVGLSTLRHNWQAWGLEAYRIGSTLKFRERNVENWLEAQRVRS